MFGHMIVLSASMTRGSEGIPNIKGVSARLGEREKAGYLVKVISALRMNL